MRKLLFALSALAALALLAPNSGIAQDDNQVGIYLVEDPDFADPDTLATQTVYDGPAGQFTAYVVVSSPVNYEYCTTVPVDTCYVRPISNLGGFEFRIEWPAGLFVTPTIHTSATNFQTPPDFYCGANAQVIDGTVTVITLTIGSFTTDPGQWYITPVSDVGSQSIPGGIAITDADEVFEITELYVSSGDFANPVFAMWPIPGEEPVPNEDATWGDVKAMFR